MVVPDVARGLALLGIAIANLPTAWLTPGAPEAAFFGSINNVFDQILVVASAMFAHNRGLPLFSTMLGFGVGLIAMSLWRKQFPAKRARQIIIRRYFFLAIFGAVHLIFIFYGDIMFYYGLTGIIIGLLLTVRDKVLAVTSYVVLGIITTGGLLLLVWGLLSGTDMSAVTEGGRIEDFDTSSYLGLLGFNAVTFVLNFLSYPVYILGYAPIMLIGFTWARRGVLADVPAHRKELSFWAVIGVVYILGIGLPWGLAEIGVLPRELAPTFLTTNLFTGGIAGPALLAIFALVLQPFQARADRGQKPSVWLQIPMALGKRSMSGYLFQSLAFFVLCYAVALGITPESVSAQVGLAFGVWMVSLILAWLMEAVNMQGPFEMMHRRLSYGSTLQPELHKKGSNKK
ncbi:DUF418 domain-containing protein [Corynebacterium sp. J010B-136]|uniref:DUF418 domain-containing protein n=1 Tax=Corynebacterium sp. J010B-136 TaxID=2099401 RepID=UPI000CF99C23|nr:DUF418 domain-containing protein [Corynebacterium sp. J010B-136]PQM75697.1 DUF418 domain-containing protein [Corynebacterium sp. J010B-136]